MIVECNLSIDKIKEGVLQGIKDMKFYKKDSFEKISSMAADIKNYDDFIALAEIMHKEFKDYKLFGRERSRYDLTDIHLLSGYIEFLTEISDPSIKIISYDLNDRAGTCYVTYEAADGAIHKAFTVGCHVTYNAQIKEESFVLDDWRGGIQVTLPYGKEVSNLIKSLREQAGLSQSEFSNKFHISKSTLANWEQGLRVPPEYVPYMISRILELEDIKKE